MVNAQMATHYQVITIELKIAKLDPDDVGVIHPFPISAFLAITDKKILYKKSCQQT